MGNLPRIPEWLAMTIWVVGGLLAWLALGHFMHRRGRRRLAAKRTCITKEEFIARLEPDADLRISEWLWDQAKPYYEPLKPHPDDHLLRDAMIDDGDVSMDWVSDFAEQMGLDEKRFPDWPVDWELTLRNYARWLQQAMDTGREFAI